MTENREKLEIEFCDVCEQRTFIDKTVTIDKDGWVPWTGTIKQIITTTCKVCGNVKIVPKYLREQTVITTHRPCPTQNTPLKVDS